MTHTSDEDDGDDDSASAICTGCAPTSIRSSSWRVSTGSLVDPAMLWSETSVSETRETITGGDDGSGDDGSCDSTSALRAGTETS